MEWLAYVATLLGLTFPLAVGFIVIGVIIVALAIIGGESYTENDRNKRANDNEFANRKSSFHPRL